MGNTIFDTPEMTWREFAATPNGTEVFNHGASECVALVNLYLRGVLDVPLPKSDRNNRFYAKYLWTLFPEDPNMKKNFKRSAKPQPGAISVHKPNLDNGNAGHTGVVLEVYKDGSFLALEQNYGWKGTPQEHVWRYHRKNDDGLYGFLIPKNNPAVGKPIKGTLKKRVKSIGANVHVRPDKGSKVLTRIAGGKEKTLWAWTPGSTYPPKSKLRAWFRVKHDGQWGWVHRSRIRNVTPVTLKRVKKI